MDISIIESIIIAETITAVVGTTYYVDDATGSDSNDGSSWGQAWKTIPKIGNVRGGNTFSEGDTCYIRDGNYSGFLEENNIDRTSWTSWIADDGHSPIIEYIVVKSAFPDAPHNKYYWFEGLTVKGGFTNDRLIIYASNYGMFKNVTMTGDGYEEGDGSAGIYIYDSNNVTIENCIINGVIDVPEGGSYRGIWIQTCSDIDVVGCDVSRCAFGINIAGTATGSANQRIRVVNNVFHDLDSDGIYTGDLSDCDITDNEIYNIDKPIHWTLNGSYTYTDSTKTLARISGDQFPTSPSLVNNIVKITSTGSGVLPVLDTTKPVIQYKHDWPGIASLTDANTLVLQSTAPEFGTDYSDITKVEIAINYHCDAIQMTDSNASAMNNNNIRIDRNIIHDVIDQGLFINMATPANCGAVYFRNNLIYNVATDVSVEDCTALYFINNTVVGDHQSIWQEDTRGAVIFQSNTTVVEFYNNVIDQLGGITTIDIVGHDNNIYYQEGLVNISYTPGGSEIDLATLADLKALVVDYDNKDFRLAGDSLAVDHADVAYAPVNDIRGFPRDANPDSGAYEYFSGYLVEAITVIETVGGGVVNLSPVSVIDAVMIVETPTVTLLGISQLYSIYPTETITVVETVVVERSGISASETIAVAETVAVEKLSVGPLSANVSETIAVTETLSGFVNKDIMFTVTTGSTLTPKFTFTGTVIEVFIDDVSDGTFTSGVSKNVIVTNGQEVRYASSNPWTNVTAVDFSGDNISGDIVQFAPFSVLTSLIFSDTQLSGNLSAFVLLVSLVTLQAYTTSITADVNCLDTQVLMTDCQVQNCGLNESEMDNLIASLVVNEAAGGAGRDCVVIAN